MAIQLRLKEVVGWGAMLLVTGLIVFPVVAIFVGPASNLYATGSLQPLSNEFPGGRVFVRNPDLVEEFEVLQASGVFQIVSAEEADAVVKLHPMEQAGVCGNPLLLTWATGGLVPSKVPIGWTFSFTVQEDGSVSKQRFVLQGERRVSLIQRFHKPFRSDTQTLGIILASEYERSR
jgi:hypothetical protein